MCVVSMVGDFYHDEWKDWGKRITPAPSPIPAPVSTTGITYVAYATKEEIDELRKEVERMKKLLIKAKIYDEENNEPNCEIENKVAFLKKIAEFVGVNLDEVFKK